MKKFNIKLIKSGVYGLFNGKTLVTWSCSASSLFRFLKCFSIRTVMLNRKRSLIKGFTSKVRKFDNVLNGTGRAMRDVPPVTDMNTFDEYQMKTIKEYYNL